MTLTPAWRTRLFASVATIVAIMLGVQVAHGALFWPSLVAGLLAAIMVISMQPRPLLALLLGGVAVGYIVGNRGFAQLSLSPGFPLLPAEFVLLVGGAILLVQCAWRRELPFRNDPLNLTLLIWMGAGTLRVFFDFREFGFAAVRDYALVYYGGFFFLSQHLARNPASTRFVLRCILFACAALLLVYPLPSRFPEFFGTTLTVRGIPLIFLKDDLAANFMAVGSLLFFLKYERSRRLVWLLVSIALAGMILTTDNRSSMLALAVAAGWLAVGGRWRFGAVLAGSGVIAAAGMLLAAELQNQSWRQTPLHQTYERVLSMTDPLGQRLYQTDKAYKGDNNVFRLVWWRAAVSEAVEKNPWVGLGFGHDLAARFVQQYNPEANDDFSARSPHNVLITVFARMGAIGLAAFLAVIASIAIATWRAVRNRRAELRADPPWVAAWVLFMAACFGVVLEGPMGAVIFWTLLGIANGLTVAEADSDLEETDQGNDGNQGHGHSEEQDREVQVSGHG
jgi:O-antigen ligase